MEIVMKTVGDASFPMIRRNGILGEVDDLLWRIGNYSRAGLTFEKVINADLAYSMCIDCGLDPDQVPICDKVKITVKGKKVDFEEYKEEEEEHPVNPEYEQWRKYFSHLPNLNMRLG